MVKAGKWIKSILIGGKKGKDKIQKEKQNSTCKTPNVITPPKEKKRWSFRRSSATKDCNSHESTPTKRDPPARVEPQHLNVEKKQPDLEIVATDEKKAGSIQDAAAVKIQSAFRSYLARKALRALRGLVKLQALVRGRLVRKRATATLRCMEALLTAQARARARRIRAVEEAKLYINHQQFTCKMNADDYNFRNSYHEMEKGMMEENIKIVEMDHGQSNNTSKTNSNNNNNNFLYNERSQIEYLKQDYANKISASPSAITDISPRTCSNHFEDHYSFPTAHSSPQCHNYYYYYHHPPFSNSFPQQEYTESLSYEYPLHPNYMANTQSSRAKARSQSAPKQRPADSSCFERQLSRRRPSVEGRSIPRAVRMQRSSSHVGANAQSYHYPLSIKLDKSAVSLMDSECGSTCSVLTNANYCKSGLPYDHQGNRY